MVVNVVPVLKSADVPPPPQPRTPVNALGVTLIDADIDQTDPETLALFNDSPLVDLA